MEGYLEVCSLHGVANIRCDCGCTCDRPSDGIKLDPLLERYWGRGQHDPRCRIFDPEFERKIRMRGVTRRPELQES